ncbi:MAG: dipicolinate synthase subunit DpsA, partial [Senegalia sp. (in: firmicutes)]
MSNKKFTVLGGDKRSIELINLLLESKNPVNVFGFDKVNKNLRIKQSESLEDAIKGSDIIIGPLPFSILEEQINLTSLLELMSKDQLLLGGKIDKDFSDKCISNNINIIDYFDREEMQILNAIPTAEGAISIAMEKLQVTISSSNALVLGYGRIGKVLSKMLNGI